MVGNAASEWLVDLTMDCADAYVPGLVTVGSSIPTQAAVIITRSGTSGTMPYSRLMTPTCVILTITRSTTRWVTSPCRFAPTSFGWPSRRWRSSRCLTRCRGAVDPAARPWCGRSAQSLHGFDPGVVRAGLAVPGQGGHLRCRGAPSQESIQGSTPRRPARALLDRRRRPRGPRCRRASISQGLRRSPAGPRPN